SKNLNRILLVTRVVLVFLLTFLLLGPIIRQINNVLEKPVFVILQDNSISVKESTDSVSRNNLRNSINALKESLADNGFEVSHQSLSGEVPTKILFNASSSDLQGALRKISNQY